MPGNRILSAPRHRILFHPALHPKSARRDSVLGLVLDQRRRKSGARLHRPADLGQLTDHTGHRPADRPHVDHSVHRRQRVTAASQLRQSDRRLDVLEGVWNSSTSGCPLALSSSSRRWWSTRWSTCMHGADLRS